jgi:hypothetical protein
MMVALEDVQQQVQQIALQQLPLYPPALPAFLDTGIVPPSWSPRCIRAHRSCPC